MPLADFDAMQATRREENSCVVLGTRYDHLPELPLAMGLDLMASDRLSAEEQRELLTRVFDFVFGAGSLQRFEEDERFSTEYAQRLVAYIRFGYRVDILDEIEDAAEKNALALAKALSQEVMIHLLSSTFASTGMPSSPTFAESMASAFPRDDSTPPTSPGENSSSS